MANFSFNKVILAGRLTSDVELKETPSGVAVATFSIAVNRKFSKEGEQQADFINCTAWRGTAEFISKYFHKGSSLCIVGSIQTRSWKDNNGNNRYATDVVVDEAMFVDSKTEAQGTGAAPNYMPDAYKPNFEDVKVDEDFPFN
jgi:single-strand DNA-binding protein